MEATDLDGTQGLHGSAGRPLRTPAGRRLFECVVAVGMGLVGVAVLALVFNGRDHTLRLDELPEGVTAHELGGDDVFIIRDGNDVRVFLSDARHLPDETLWWCPNEEVFIEVEHGSMFDRQGRKIGGPAAGGLNQYEVRTDGGELIVHRWEVIVGGVDPPWRGPSGARRRRLLAAIQFRSRVVL